MRDPKELDFFEHLEELRSRILRSAAYIIIGMIIVWFMRHDLFLMVKAPLWDGAERAGFHPNDPAINDIIVAGDRVTSGFIFSLQLAFFGGILVSFPAMALEAWLFIEPALLDHERKYVLVILPFSVLLFVAGVVFCYLIAPLGIAFLLKFQMDMGMTPVLNVIEYMRFILRLLLIFGLVFQLPMVLMFLSFVGLVSSRQLIDKWRYAVVAIFLIAAIATPTTDPFTMTILAVPVMLLYGLSIVLAIVVEKRRRSAEEEEDEPAEPTKPALAEANPARDAEVADEPDLPEDQSADQGEGDEGEDEWDESRDDMKMH
ncbi:MAG: twin-arginine translocase subunit TatC [Armatimonadota bacterium]